MQRAPEFRALGLTFTVNVGARLPAYATALGRVLLASLPDDELDRRLTRITLEPLTPLAITGGDVFRAELMRIREQGWATTSNQIGLGVGAVSVPIINNRGETSAALNVLVRVAHNATELDPTPFLEDLRAAARQIAAVVEATNPVAFKNPW